MNLLKQLSALSADYPTMTVKNLVLLLSISEKGPMTSNQIAKANKMELSQCRKIITRFTNEIPILSFKNQQKGGRLRFISPEVQAKFPEIFFI